MGACGCTVCSRDACYYAYATTVHDNVIKFNFLCACRVTPLHIACSGRFLAAVPLLLLHGACPLVLDAAGVDSATLAAGTRAYASFQPVAAVMFGMEPS
jgi:hypothetical protein